MYYSIVCPGTLDGANSWGERAFIGLLENSNPANNNGWEDKGYVITNASDKGLNFHIKPDDWANCYYKWNAIDPSYLIDNDGKHYLIYGSWHSGIAALEVDAETGKPLNTLPAPWGTSEDIAAYGSLITTRQMGNRCKPRKDRKSSTMPLPITIIYLWLRRIGHPLQYPCLPLPKYQWSLPRHRRCQS